jgi:transcriptional regulator with XRE-family HTH domain
MGKLRAKVYRGLAKPGPIDAHIGARIRLRRRQLGMQQASLGEAIGVLFQQVQNYEMGKVRISAARLYYMAKALDVPVEFFYAGAPDFLAASTPAQGAAKARKALNYELDAIVRRETVELVRAFYEISDPQVRKELFTMINVLGAASSGRGQKGRPE